jgi:hypothetical protein
MPDCGSPAELDLKYSQNCGSWLACDSVGSADTFVTGRPLSQASQLPLSGFDVGALLQALEVALHFQRV